MNKYGCRTAAEIENIDYCEQMNAEQPRGASSLQDIWANSRGFSGGATRKQIFLHAAAMAGYQNKVADAFLAGVS